MTDAEIIALLAGQARIYRDNNNGWELVTHHAGIHIDQLRRLVDEGWLDPHANGGGYRLSDDGRKQFLKSTDEMGDGKLVSPEAALKVSQP